MNNRGVLGDQMYLIYFIFLLIVITGSIVAGSYFVFGNSYDSRSADSSLLIGFTVECLEEKPFSEQELRNIVEVCEINLHDDDILHISIGETEFFKKGDRIVCGLQDRYENGPRCSSGFTKVNINGILTDVKIIAGSGSK